MFSKMLFQQFFLFFIVTKCNIIIKIVSKSNNKNGRTVILSTSCSNVQIKFVVLSGCINIRHIFFKKIKKTYYSAVMPQGARDPVFDPYLRLCKFIFMYSLDINLLTPILLRQTALVALGIHKPCRAVASNLVSVYILVFFQFVLTY